MPVGVIEEKAALRRAAQSWDTVDWAPLVERFLALPEVAGARRLLLFYGVGREPDTVELMDRLWAMGKELALPRCLPGRQMEARLVRSLNHLQPGPYGIPQPGEDCPPVARRELDVILVPNLCCDRGGYRLGHGGGYYDRYLAGYGGYTVALCPGRWLQKRLPREEHDLPLNLILTEEESILTPM